MNDKEDLEDIIRYQEQSIKHLQEEAWALENKIDKCNFYLDLVYQEKKKQIEILNSNKKHLKKLLSE